MNLSLQKIGVWMVVAVPVVAALLLSLSLSSCSMMKEIQNLGAASEGTTSSIEAIAYPKLFPAPRYPDATPTAAADTTIDKIRIRSVTMISNDDPATVCKVYAKWFQKHEWNIKNPASDMGMGWSISAEKDLDTVNITALRQKDSKQTTLTLNVSTKIENETKPSTR